LAKVQGHISHVLAVIEEATGHDRLNLCARAWVHSSGSETPPWVRDYIAECLDAYERASAVLRKALRGPGQQPKHRIRNMILVQTAWSLAGKFGVTAVSLNYAKKQKIAERVEAGKKRLLSLETQSSLLEEALRQLNRERLNLS
jgi:hypothetical protein